MPCKCTPVPSPNRISCSSANGPRRYPARQTLEASQAVARQHGLNPARVVFAQQAPAAIDAGVFHNDVIAVGNRDVLFYHQHAFAAADATLAALADAMHGVGASLRPLQVPAAAVSIEDAVRSYLFNSQLLSRADGRMLLVVPEECRHVEPVWAYLQDLLASQGPIAEVRVFDLKQSMQNGGGPACLRLRVALTADECAAVNPAVWINDARYASLCAWVDRHYRDRLSADDLADPQLLQECRTALDELTQLLQLGAVYPFQRG